jgi:hypothetical protein
MPIFASVSRWRKLVKWLLVGLAVVLLTAAIYGVTDELQTSRLQAELLGKVASELHFKVEPGSSDAIRFPGSEPYDERLGYRAISGSSNGSDPKATLSLPRRACRRGSSS